MKKRNAAVIISAAFLLTGCGAVRHEISEEQTTVAELPATTEKAQEITTERPTEAKAEATTAAATEPETEEATEAQDPGKILFVSERKTAERTAITTEETTGEINAEGYGWVCLQY